MDKDRTCYIALLACFDLKKSKKHGKVEADHPVYQLISWLALALDRFFLIEKIYQQFSMKYGPSNIITTLID